MPRQAEPKAKNALGSLLQAVRTAALAIIALGAVMALMLACVTEETTPTPAPVPSPTAAPVPSPTTTLALSPTASPTPSPTVTPTPAPRRQTPRATPTPAPRFGIQDALPSLDDGQIVRSDIELVEHPWQRFLERRSGHLLITWDGINWYNFDVLVEAFPQLFWGIHYVIYPYKIEFTYDWDTIADLCHERGAYTLLNGVVTADPACLAEEADACVYITPHGAEPYQKKRVCANELVGEEFISQRWPPHPSALEGTFTVPKGARSFHLAMSGVREGFALIDPNGRDHVELAENARVVRSRFEVFTKEWIALVKRLRIADDAEAEAIHAELEELGASIQLVVSDLEEVEQQPGLISFRYHGEYIVAMAQETSDLHYSHEAVVVPGEWTIRARVPSNATEQQDSPAAAIAIKTRNDPDDRVRLRAVNASLQSNEDIRRGLERMAELAKHFGINVEITQIDRIDHLNNSSWVWGNEARHWDFCERFCSPDEALVLITEPGGWGSFNGAALQIAHLGTHFLIGPEIASRYPHDHYPLAALHELLHHIAGLHHPFEHRTDIPAASATDPLLSTGSYNEFVDGFVDVAGGVNFRNLLETNRLTWNANVMWGWPLFEYVEDVDGVGYSDAYGRRRTLVSFIERHQLNWVRNSPLYW